MTITSGHLREFQLDGRFIADDRNIQVPEKLSLVKFKSMANVRDICVFVV
jgi:hypothetical protein